MKPGRTLTLAWVVWMEMLRRKDFYVLLILLGAMLFALLSLDVFGLGGAVAYVADTGLLLSWLFSLVLTVSLLSRQLPSEEQRGTIFPLLAKPVRRSEVLVGKWLGAWVSVTAATAVFYLLVALVLLLHRAPPGAVFFQAWVLHAAALAVASGITLCCSTRMTAGAAAATSFTALAASFLIVPRIPVLVAHAEPAAGAALLALYHALPHMELFDLRQRVVHGWGPAPWHIFAAVLLYAACYTAVLLLLSWLAYRGKRFQREEAC